MVNIIRKYQQTLMLLVTIVVIICFVWLYNDTRWFDRIGADRIGSIYGRQLTRAHYGREARKFDVCRALGLIELWATLIGSSARSENEAIDNFVWNSLVLRHEAAAHDIEPTDDEVIAEVQQLPAFQTSGVYDSSKYNDFVEKIGARGFTGEQIEELVRDHLRLEKLKALVGATVAAAPEEVRTLFERRNQKSEVAVVRLKLDDFSKAVQITDEDLKKLYEERKEGLKSDELRKVKRAAFTLEKVETPLTGKARMDELSKLADRAQEFAVAMTEKGASFDEAAKKFGVEAKETPEFARDDPPAELGESEEAARAAFEKLTMEQPNSDVVMTDSGYYVLQLTGITPARPLTFDEAKPKLAEQLKQERANEAMNLKATELRNKIDAEVKAGKSFADAATAAGAKPEALPPFSLMEPPKADVPDGRIIMGRSLELTEGQLSDVTPTPGGVVILRVEKRLPIDEQKFEQEKTMLAENVARGKREAAFELWLKNRRDAAGIQEGQG